MAFPPLPLSPLPTCDSLPVNQKAANSILVFVIAHLFFRLSALCEVCMSFGISTCGASRFFLHVTFLYDSNTCSMAVPALLFQWGQLKHIFFSIIYHVQTCVVICSNVRPHQVTHQESQQPSAVVLIDVVPRDCYMYTVVRFHYCTGRMINPGGTLHFPPLRSFACVLLC